VPVVYNFEGVSSLYVCQTITFESLDVRSSYLHIRYISMKNASNSYMKVIESRSPVTTVQNPYFRNAKLSSAIYSGSIKCRPMKFACDMVCSDMADRMV